VIDPAERPDVLRGLASVARANFAPAPSSSGR
jgi:hypothetical protein